ncbi:MAG TPA: trypsin-like serine protease [Polyangiaceae bacterium]|nr:trypsin-like serine protease [Polyangiaceae bacterium]
MKLGLGLCCVLSLTAAVGCGQTGAERSSWQTQAVYDGTPSGPEDDGVVKLAATDAAGVTNFCTGSLIAPNVVLTARHCVSNMAQGTFTCTDTGELTTDSKGGRFGALIDPASLKIYVGAEFTEPLAALGAKVFATQTPSICRNDLATIVLDRELIGTPLMPIRMDRGNQRGEVLRVVGFGETEESTRGVRRAKDGLVISQVGSSQFRPDGDPIPPRTFLTLGSGPCIGDSGGPALSSQGAVTGVYSQLGGACESATARQYFTQVAPFVAEVLMPAFELTGYEPIPEAMTTGDAGAGGDGATVGEAGAPSSSAGGNGNAAGGPPDGMNTSPPEKGGCRCSTTATPRAGFLDRLAAFVALGAALTARSRRRRRGSASG